MKENKRKHKTLSKSNVFNNATLDTGLSGYVKKDLTKSFLISFAAFLLIYAIYYLEKNPQLLNVLLRR